MAQDLHSYEQIVESLVQEIERYGNARASVDSARHEIVKLQARVEAAGKQAEETARLSAQFLDEIRRFTPDDLTSPILEALSSEGTTATGRHQDLQGQLSKLELAATKAESAHARIAADIKDSSVSLVRLTRILYASVALNVIVILILLLR